MTKASTRTFDRRAYKAQYHRDHYKFKHGYNTRYYKLAPFINGLQGAGGVDCSVQDIACIAGVTTRTVYRWIEEGHLEAHKSGKFWQVKL
jgi:excisionase family DNA binding protein